MRDPRRIEEILREIGEIWRKEPDLRLGQLVVIGARPREPQPHIFYVEDEVLLEGLRLYKSNLESGDL